MIPGASVICEKRKLTKNEQIRPDLTSFFKSLAIEKYPDFVYDEENRKDRTMDKNLHDTQFFQAVQENKMNVNQVLQLVYEALSEKGYNPVNQIVGYVMSGDPTYITSHKNARSLIMKVERDEILEELLSYYIKGKFGGSD